MTKAKKTLGEHGETAGCHLEKFQCCLVAPASEGRRRKHDDPINGAQCCGAASLAHSVEEGRGAFAQVLNVVLVCSGRARVMPARTKFEKELVITKLWSSVRGSSVSTWSTSACASAPFELQTIAN